MQTALQIAFKNLEPSPSIEAHIGKRVQRLELLRRDIVSCRVVVEATNHSLNPKTPLTVTIDVEVPGRTVIGKDSEQRHETHNDALSALNHAFEAVERQLEDDIKTKRGRARGANGDKRNGDVAADTSSQDD